MIRRLWVLIGLTPALIFGLGVLAGLAIVLRGCVSS